MTIESEAVVETIAVWMGRDVSRASAGAELLRDILNLESQPEWVGLAETAKRIGCSESYLYHSWKKLGGKKEAGRVVFPSEFGLKRRAFDAG